jgi:hypothetical protein
MFKKMFKNYDELFFESLRTKEDRLKDFDKMQTIED